MLILESDYIQDCIDEGIVGAAVGGLSAYAGGKAGARASYYVKGTENNPNNGNGNAPNNLVKFINQAVAKIDKDLRVNEFKIKFNNGGTPTIKINATAFKNGKNTGVPKSMDGYVRKGMITQNQLNKLYADINNFVKKFPEYDSTNVLKHNIALSDDQVAMTAAMGAGMGAMTMPI